jgi:hypothetical protein
MSIQEAIGLTISLVALLIAVYGIFERQRAAYSTVRVRITELLAELEALNIEEDRYVEEAGRQQPAQGAEPDDYPPVTATALGAITGRRALLVYQALALVRRLERARLGRFDDLRLTPSEYGSLANALARVGDYPSALEQWAAAVGSRVETTDRVRIANHNGYAHSLFTSGKLDAARRQFHAAIDLEPGDSGGRRDAYAICRGWLERELDAGSHGTPADVVRLARAIVEPAAQDEASQPWALPASMDLRRLATRDVYVGDGYAREVIGFEDDLSAAASA